MRLVGAALAMALHVGLAAPGDWAGIVASESACRSFFADSLPELLVYVNRGDRNVYFVDFLADSLVERRITVRSPARSPMVSPDGGTVAFECEGRIYFAPIIESAEAVEVARGYEPHWWVDPHSADTFVTYGTDYGKYRWPSPGYTLRRAASPSNLQVGGTADTLLAFSMKGGLSASGRYIGTGYSTGVIYDLLADTAFTVYGGAQTCNVSMNPTADSIAERHMMMLVCPHTSFQIRDIDDRLVWSIANPEGTVEWQEPEWSNNPNYCAAIATADPAKVTGYDVYAVRLADKATLRLLDGDYEYPVLWFRRGGAARAATPTISPGSGTFGGECHVTIRSCEAGAQIRYTVDGTPPGPTSPVFRDVVVVTPPCRVTAVSYVGGMTESRPAVADYWNGPVRTPDGPVDVVPGVEYCLARGLDWDQAPLPNGSSGIVACGHLDSISLAPADGGISYGMVFRCYFSAPRSGNYLFATLSAEGSVLYIGDWKVVDNDGRHPLGTRTGEIGLGAGLHALSVTYFSATELPTLALFVAQPGQPALPMPSNLLFRDAEPALEILTPVGGETYPVGSIMEIRWVADTTRVKAVVVELSPNGGRTWVEITPGAIGPSDSNWLELGWVVPDSLPDGQSLLSPYCLIRVREYERGLTDVSDKVFTIAPTVSSPRSPRTTFGLRDVPMQFYDVRGRRQGGGTRWERPEDAAHAATGVVVLSQSGRIARRRVALPDQRGLAGPH